MTAMKAKAQQSADEIERVCRDPKCEHAGEPQPLDNFQPHPKGPRGRMRVCRACFRRKQRDPHEGPLGRADGHDPDVVKTRGRPRKVAAPSAANGASRPAAPGTHAWLVEVARQLVAGRHDGRSDLPPYFGPRTHRELAAEMLDELGKRSKV